jgi:hypothetical protein
MLMTELLIAMAILILAVIPLAMCFVQESKVLRQSYQRAVAMELIDGEMEILLAGEWRSFKEGTQSYPLSGDAQKNLPPGQAVLSITGKHVRLEWQPEKGNLVTAVVREGVVQ